MKYLKKASKFNNLPVVEVKNDHYKVINGWEAICSRLNKEISALGGKKKIVVIETYQGVIHEELIINLKDGLNHTRFILAEDFMLPEEEIKKLVFQDVTNDRIFGFLTRLTLDSFFDTDKVSAIQAEIESQKEGVIVIYGCGAALLCPKPDLLVYADMARWAVSYTHLRAHETRHDLVCRLLLEKKQKTHKK